MGQANTSLPDPLSAPASGLAGTDDLLSQLAGDEIDRLLAEADVAAPSNAAAELDESVSGAVSVNDLVTTDASTAAASTAADEALARLDEVQKKADEVEQTVRELTEKPTAAKSAPVAPAAAKPAPADDPDAALNAELDALFDELNQSNPGQGPAKTEVAVAATPEAKTESSGKGETLQASEIDELFKQLTADPGTAVVETATEPAVADEPEPAAAVAPKAPVETPAPAAVAAAPAAAAVAVEAAASADSGLAELANTVGSSHDAKEAEHASTAPVPLLLKPLEWINAPFANLPDELREFVGKAAIITVVNALAVMMYVMFFRH